MSKPSINTITITAWTWPTASHDRRDVQRAGGAQYAVAYEHYERAGEPVVGRFNIYRDGRQIAHGDLQYAGEIDLYDMADFPINASTYPELQRAIVRFLTAINLPT